MQFCTPKHVPADAAVTVQLVMNDLRQLINSWHQSEATLESHVCVTLLVHANEQQLILITLRSLVRSRKSMRRKAVSRSAAVGLGGPHKSLMTEGKA